MEFGILGPLSVRDDAGPRVVHAAKQRILLAALLVRPEETVPLEKLADLVWDGRPPVSQVATMRNYVMRLRRRLGSAGFRIKTSFGGYRIDVERHEFDVLRFARLRAAGAAAFGAGEYGRAVRLLGDALAVWRGPVLADVPSQRLLREEAPRLDTMRLDTIGLQVRAQLVLGEHAGLVPRLRSLTAEYPRREQFWGLLMAALALTERQADALTVFAQASAALELGEEAEPGAQLWHIRQLIADGGDDLRLIPLSHLEDPACSMV